MPKAIPAAEQYGLWLGKAGGRKFVVTVLVQMVNAILLWHHDLTPDPYAAVVVGTIGAYIAGNAYQAAKRQ